MRVLNQALVLVCLALSAVLVVSGSALATLAEAEPAPALAVSPSTAAPGKSVRVRGSGFTGEGRPGNSSASPSLWRRPGPDAELRRGPEHRLHSKDDYRDEASQRPPDT